MYHDVLVHHAIDERFQSRRPRAKTEIGIAHAGNAVDARRDGTAQDDNLDYGRQY